MKNKRINRRDFVKLVGCGAMGLAITSFQANSFQKDYNKLENKVETLAEDISKTNIKTKEFVENAKKYLGTQYHWGGRLTKKYPGLDCLGLLFVAHSETFGSKWYDFSVYPSKIVEKNQLGKPVKGLDGILSKDLDFSKLKEGDIIYLLSESIIRDKPLANIQGKDYWPWHTGMYSNKEENLFLEASPLLKEVVESNFKKILEDNPKLNKAIFVTRIDY